MYIATMANTRHDPWTKPVR